MTPVVTIWILENKGNRGIMNNAIEQSNSSTEKAGARKTTVKKKAVNESTKKTAADSEKKSLPKKPAAKKKAVKETTKKTSANAASEKKSSDKKAVAKKKTVTKTVKKAVADTATKKAVVKKKVVNKATKKTATANKKKALSSTKITPQDHWKMIEKAAYLRAEKHGFTGSNPVDDWLAAEAEVNRYLEEHNIHLTQG